MRSNLAFVLVISGAVTLALAACEGEDETAGFPATGVAGNGDGGANGPGPNGGDAARGDGGPNSGNDGGLNGNDGGPNANPGWDYAKIGGGGFVTGGTIAADGTKFFRTDTSGGYLYDDATGRFNQVVPRNIPATANNFWNGTGVFEAMIAGSDSNTLYAAYNNTIYRSTDKGATFTRTMADFTFGSNSGGMRTLERHGQVDPQNPQHVLFGDEVALYRTTDGGATWQVVSSVAASQSFNGDTKGFSGIAFNPKSALVNGRTSEAIVSTGGRYFRTTNAGDSFDEISGGGPNDAPQMGEFDGKGRYFASASASGSIWRYASGAWQNLNVTNSFDTTFFIDPTNDDALIINRAFDLAWQRSSNGGNTWDVVGNWEMPLQNSVDGIPWHSTKPHYFNANLMLDVAHSTLWLPGGNQGVASIPLSGLTGAAPYTAQMHGIGIENLCINVMVAPKGSQKLHAAVWDESYAEIDRSNKSYPSVVNDVGGLAASWGIAGSKENPKMLARWLSGAMEKSGWTDDSGATWHPFAKLPADVTDASVWGYGGTIAYSGIDNIIVVSSNTNSQSGMLKMPYYTKDRGATWNPVTLPTPWTAANIAGVHFAYYLNRQILVADASQLGRFYFFVASDDSSFAGIYRTDDGGATWTQAHAGLPGNQFPGSWGYNAHIESPVTNHLWMTAGSEAPDAEMGSGQLLRSTDGGVTFTPIPDVNEPGKFGFGAPAHPGGYPILFMEGYYKGQPGVWMSANADAASPTWISLGPTPNGQFVAPNYIVGDPDVPGRLWVATGCAGVQFGEFGHLLP